jgi:hypothetical protein
MNIIYTYVSIFMHIHIREGGPDWLKLDLISVGDDSVEELAFWEI